ncbi:MAG TPA: hypothetical protein VK402_13795 [Blastococcus sp.]|nr:hypothetical protein [Blastococcus sp.]
MATPEPAVRTRPGWPVLLVAALSGVALLLVGFLYLVSGLAVPGYALIPLWIWWFVQAWYLVRLAARGSWWTPLVPVVALVSWWAVLMIGGNLLNWTA